MFYDLGCMAKNRTFGALSLEGLGFWRGSRVRGSRGCRFRCLSDLPTGSLGPGKECRGEVRKSSGDGVAFGSPKAGLGLRDSGSGLHDRRETPIRTRRCSKKTLNFGCSMARQDSTFEFPPNHHWVKAISYREVGTEQGLLH